MKTHKKDPNWPNGHFSFSLTECGLVKQKPQFEGKEKTMQITDEWDGMNCKNCLKKRPKED